VSGWSGTQARPGAFVWGGERRPVILGAMDIGEVAKASGGAGMIGARYAW
jgi:hypothetical protein